MLKIKSVSWVLVWGAAGAVVFPGALVQVTEHGDMIELASPLWLGSQDLDFETRVEAPRTVYELTIAQPATSTATEYPPEDSMDWYQPLAIPQFNKRPMIADWIVADPLLFETERK